MATKGPRTADCTPAIAAVVAVVAALVSVLGTPAAFAVSKDTRIANAGLVAQRDLPKEWEQQPPDSPSSSSVDIGTDAQQLPACQKYAPLFGLGDGPSDSTDKIGPDFKLAGEVVGSSVEVFRSTRQAKALFASVRDPDFAACLNALFPIVIKAAIAQDGTVPPAVVATTTVEVTTPTVARVGDETFDIRSKVSLMGVSLFFDLQLVRVGRATGTYKFLGLTDPLPLRPRVVSAAAKRLRAAQR